MEEWRVVPGTNDKIEVSNMGRVRSLLRGEPYILKTQADSKGYLRLRVTIERKKLSFKVHRIVAQAFIENPDNLPQVNHIDGNRANNNVNNLEWVTNQQNVIHSFAMRCGETNTRFEDLKYKPGRMRVNGKQIYLKRNYKPFNPNPQKPIEAYKGDEVIKFESVAEAERYFDSRHVVDVLKGRRAHVKGWSFSYAKGGDAYVNPSN